MVNLEEWSNEELEKRVDVVLSLFHKVKKGEKISLLDFAPEYREILRDKTYGSWFPTGERARQNICIPSWRAPPKALLPALLALRRSIPRR